MKRVGSGGRNAFSRASPFARQIVPDPCNGGNFSPAVRERTAGVFLFFEGPSPSARVTEPRPRWMADARGALGHGNDFCLQRDPVAKDRMRAVLFRHAALLGIHKAAHLGGDTVLGCRLSLRMTGTMPRIFSGFFAGLLRRFAGLVEAFGSNFPGDFIRVFWGDFVARTPCKSHGGPPRLSTRPCANTCASGGRAAWVDGLRGRRCVFSPPEKIWRAFYFCLRMREKSTCCSQACQKEAVCPQGGMPVGVVQRRPEI